MLPTQFILWLIIFPLVVCGFLINTSVRAFIFLFNCPFDTWRYIGKSLDEIQLEEKNRRE
jgi:hypothetical protein